MAFVQLTWLYELTNFTCIAISKCLFHSAIFAFLHVDQIVNRIIKSNRIMFTDMHNIYNTDVNIHMYNDSSNQRSIIMNETSCMVLKRKFHSLRTNKY